MSTAMFLALALAGPGPAGEAFAIRCQHAVVGTAEVPDAVVVVSNGKIEAAGKTSEVELPEGIRVVDWDGWLSPGLIACHAYSGVDGDNDDTTRTMLPAARVADSYPPGHADFHDLLAAGITTAVLAPTPENLVGGLTTVVKTAGGEPLKEVGHLAVSLSSSALSSKRAPTSAAGALAALDQALSEPEGPFASVVDLKLPLLIDVHDRHEILRAIELCRKHRVGGALYRAPLAGEVRDHLRTSRLGVIAEPMGLGHSEREVRAFVALSEIGIPVAFGLDAPENGADTLRLSAAMCLRAGMKPEAAIRALTIDAARIAGVAKRVGNLAAGLDADLVLWSGPPLDLTSSVEAVYVDGRRVYGGER